MMNLIKFTVLLIVSLSIPAAAEAQISADAAVRSFYANERTASQVFNRRNLDQRRIWLSARLYDLFRLELRRQTAHQKTNPDEKPFFGDGFPFRPIDEPCEVGSRSYKRGYRVLPGRARRGRVDVPVQFSYPQPCTIQPVTYTARVIRAGTKWLIDDIVFDDGVVLSESIKNHRY